MDIESVASHCQSVARGNPVIVLGSGVSVPHGIRGMSDLAKALADQIVPEGEEESVCWSAVKQTLLNGDHLEAALEKATAPASLVEKIVRCTWHCIAQDDRALLLSALFDHLELPAQRLFRGLFLSTNKNIHVVTPNYDRLTEYAADLGGYIHHTGFRPGYLRRSEGAENLNFRQGNHRARTVTVWKVHGSLDWFQTPDGEVISMPMGDDLPPGVRPLMVTPGVSKYQRTHEEPFRSAIQGADRALATAQAVLCIGYGFRDAHIHPKLATRCRVQNIPILIAARTLTPEAKHFIKISAGSQFIALEAASGGTKCYTSASPEGDVLPGYNLWDLNELNEIIGF